MQAGAVYVPLPHQSQIGHGILLQHLDGVLMPGELGGVDGGGGAGKRRGWPGFSAPVRADARVQALGVMTSAQQVGATQKPSLVAAWLVTATTAAGEAAVLGVAGVRGGGVELIAVSGVRRCGRQPQEVRELQVALV